jgi:hypothetical protein
MKKPLEPKDASANNVTTATLPKTKELTYEPWEIQYHRDVLNLIKSAKNQRETKWREFDHQPYSYWIDHAKSIDLAEVLPAKNKYDIRIVSGLGREKTTTAVSVALSYDFDVKVMAFDKTDIFLKGLSDACTDLIYKSNKMELWDSNRQGVYRGMAAYGTFFTLEVVEFPTTSNKTNVPLSAIGKINVNWEDRPRKKAVEFRTVELDPKMVIVGSMREKELSKQPFMAICRILSEAEARSLFGAWDRWGYVPLRTGMTSMNTATGEKDLFTEYFENFSVSDSLAEGEVEMTMFMRSLPFGNELAIYLNGVAMLPVKNRGQMKDSDAYQVSGFPLTSVSAGGEYPITDWHLERMNNFFYSKGFSTKTRFDSDVLDFWVKYLVKKAQRSGNPPMGNNSGIQITSEMLQPNAIVSDIRQNSLFSILPPEMVSGITTGEVSFYNMIKTEMDEKTMSREFSGETVNQYQSAKQFTENKKAQLLKLGALTDGIVRGEMRRAHIRLTNSIIPYWFGLQDKEARSEKIANGVAEIYDSFTVDKNDKKGAYTSVINVGKSKDFDEFDIMGMEDREEKETGAKKRYTYLDPEEYDFMRTLFYYKAQPNERDNDALQRANADQDIITALNIFGQDVDMEKAKERFARVRGDNTDDWFAEAQGLTPDMLAGAMGAGATPGGIPNMGGMNAASATPPSSMALSK